MAKMIINGEVCSGSTSYASAVEYTKEDGTKSTVQNELDELNTNMVELNSNLITFPDYSKAENLIREQTPTTYTIEKDGFYYITSLQTDANYTNGITLKINGATVIDFSTGNTTQWSRSTSMFILQKGDVLTFVYADSTRGNIDIDYVPFK